ncbi:hypothetical protein AB0C52_23770 [Streptomyces sp. NPDC048717]|uniref:hypothetical protein n=1 Tax=Streptomyces sp. NPDC048717 TaxID=3154928 RepID=UPI003413B23E
MLNQIMAAVRSRSAAPDDANIPPLPVRETRSASDWDVTLQAPLFVSLVILPLILITGSWEAPTSAAIMGIAVRAARGSSFRFRRLRWS